MSQFGLGLSLAFIWVAFSLPTSISNSCDDGEAFHFGHIFVGADGSGVPQVEKAVQLAVEKINATMPLLSYKFNYTARATKCQQLEGLQTFFDLVTMRCPKIIALAGYNCPELTREVLRLSPFWNILQISYDSGTMLPDSNGVRTNFITTYPSDVHLVSLITAVLRYYGWNQVHLITQNEAQFTETTSALKLAWDNATQPLNEILIQTMGIIPRNIFPAETRIFVLNMDPLHARRVICYAVQQDEAGLDPSHYYAEYVWITLGWYPQQWWTKGVTPDSQYTDNFIACSDAALEDMLHWALAVNHRPQPLNSTGNTDVNYTPAQFETLMMAAGPSTSASDYFFQTSLAPFAYDAIFALAFALNNSIALLGNNTSGGGNLTTYLKTEMLKLRFTGVTGPVTFDSNGTRIQASLQVMQYRRHNGSITCGNASSTGYFERVAIGTVNNGAFQYISCENNQTVWGSLVPPDGSQRTTYTVIELPLFIIYSILASIGIVFAIVCALFNVIFRNRKIVRLTSPNLNYVIVLGAVLMLISIYLYCLSTNDKKTKNIAAKVRLWTQVIGFSLCFGTILAKVWRVYYIFHNPSATKKKPPKDWQLLVFVMALVIVDITYLIVIAFLDDYAPKLEEDKEKHTNRGENYLLNSYMYFKAEGKHEKVWKATIYVYKALLQAAACILAFRTRKVHIKALNDYKYIATIIYTTSTLLTISVIGLFILTRYQNGFAVVYSTGLLIVTILVLALLFIPKMVILYRDPKGENIFERNNTLSQLSAVKGSFIELDKERMLEKRVRDLEMRLGKYEVVESMSPCCDTLTLQNSISGSKVQLNTLVHPTTDIMKLKPVKSSCEDLELSGSSCNSPSDGDIRKTALEGGHFDSECSETVKKMKVSFSESEMQSVAVTVDNSTIHQCNYNA